MSEGSICKDVDNFNASTKNNYIDILVVIMYNKSSCKDESGHR